MAGFQTSTEDHDIDMVLEPCMVSGSVVSPEIHVAGFVE